MNVLSEFIEIECTKNILTFRCKGDSGEREIQYENNEDDVTMEWTEHVKLKKVIGIYELKNIMLFTKCSQLSPQIMITIKNNNILTIKYEINTIGNLIVALSPIDERNINKNYNYSDDEDDIKIKKNNEDEIEENTEEDIEEVDNKRKKNIKKSKTLNDNSSEESKKVKEKKNKK